MFTHLFGETSTLTCTLTSSLLKHLKALLKLTLHWFLYQSVCLIHRNAYYIMKYISCTKSILNLYIHVCQEKGCIYRFKHVLLMFKTKFFLLGVFIQFDSNDALIINVGIIMPKVVIESLLWHINQRVRLHNLLGSLVLTSS